MQTPQQQRARFALEHVQGAARALLPKEQAEYKSYAKNLPFMIHTCGLGQAAAFFCSKGAIHGKLYTVLSTWLVGEGQVYRGEKDLLGALTAGTMEAYFAAQVEAMEIMEWVSKFADAFLADGPATDGDAEEATP